MTATSLVVGSGGLLGSAVVRDLRRRQLPYRCAVVPWASPGQAVTALAEQAHGLSRSGEPWRVYWCAGAGVVGTSSTQFADEVATFGGFLDALAALSGSKPEAMFLASSAGGVYAGSAAPPFTENTEPVPISAYGEAKLATEFRFRRFAESTGVSGCIGRLSNLYGPGQNLAKAQGLISQLCKASYERRPLSIFVSLDTARDYLFADDAGRMVTRMTDRAATLQPGSVALKILASHQSTTVASILGEMRRLMRRRPLVVLGQSPLARLQVRDLRFQSLVWTDVDRLATTPLAAGIGATMEDLGRLAWRVQVAGERPVSSAGAPR